MKDIGFALLSLEEDHRSMRMDICQCMDGHISAIGLHSYPPVRYRQVGAAGRRGA